MDIIPSYMDTNIRLVVAGLFLAVSVILVFISVKSSLAQHLQINRRLAGGVQADGPCDNGQGKAHWLGKLAVHLTLPDSEEISRIRYWLSQAGYFSPSAVNTFYVIRVISIVLPQILLIVFWGVLSKELTQTNLLGLSVMLAIAGFMGPGFVVNQRKSRRTLSCKEGFPDMMDLLLACIEAGLSLDAAMIRVADEVGGRYPALKIGLDMMNLELRAGRNRHEALLNFAKRIDLEEARALAVMLKQSEEMGSSLGAALRTFSEEMRATRMLMAEERALALSAKLTLPLILFIFPTILVILLLPAGIRLAGAF